MKKLIVCIFVSIILCLFTSMTYAANVKIFTEDDVNVSTEDYTCVPDFNNDGVVNIEDVKQKAMYEIFEYQMWLVLCWTLNQDDQILKGLDMAKEFANWAYECWWPSVTVESPEADLEEAVKAIDHFEEAVTAIDDMNVSTEGDTCVPDFNNDGVVNIEDVKQKAMYEIFEYQMWLVLCWTRSN
jgi:predicted amino acid-binding ACT domain protein